MDSKIIRISRTASKDRHLPKKPMASSETVICNVCAQSVSSKVAFTVRQFVACSRVCLRKLRDTQLKALTDRERKDEDDLYQKLQRLGVMSNSGGGGPKA